MILAFSHSRLPDAPRRLKKLSRPLQDSPRGLQEHPCYRPLACLQRPSNGCRTADRDSTTSPEWPKKQLRRLKRPPRRPKSSPRRPRWPQDSPRSSQGAPRALQEASRVTPKTRYQVPSPRAPAQWLTISRTPVLPALGLPPEALKWV